MATPPKNPAPKKASVDKAAEAPAAETAVTAKAKPVPKSKAEKPGAKVGQVVETAAAEKRGKALAHKTLKVRQTGSPLRRPAHQRATLQGLGLNKMGRERVLEDTPSIRGAIAKVAHMVTVIESK